ncbi:Alpha/Beta hydrolase protein [Penicillium angulare]|uniref:Alpha/Beta hydrolase protein n=1 Tax=Penicillium angulare TaxID=116970 RepID=A0A9W9K5Y6_9EURO|nr:Alpha/Beta hydrolase protein [Penicillium angulare]
MASHYFQISSDTSIHARITHPANKNSEKPLLVFLHYYGGTSSTWYKLTSPESSTSLSVLYPTISIDLRGWGQSTGPTTDEGSAYSVSSMASDVAIVLEMLSTTESTKGLLEHGLVVVGHSMGAKTALGTITHISRNLIAAFKGLVLVAPAAPASLDLPLEMKAQQQVAYNSDESIRWTVENVLANAERLSAFDKDLIVRDSLSGNELAKKAWPSYGMVEDICPALKDTLVSMQTGLRASVIFGEFDIVEPKERVEAEVGHFLTENGVQVVLKKADGVKHLIPLEAPTVIYDEVCRVW